MNEKNSAGRLFTVFAAVFVACLLLSNLVAGKLWAVTPSISLPAAVILFPVTYILGDVLTEVYGFRAARKVIWLGFGCSFFAVAVYMAVIALPSPDFWTGQEAYRTVLGTTPRVALASFAGYLFGEFSNSIILSKLKVATGGKRLWMRTILSTVVGEGFDSLIFIGIAFFGTMPAGQLFSMILFQYLFKVGYEIVFTPVTYAVVNAVKRAEGVDVYDKGVSYNVFTDGGSEI